MDALFNYSESVFNVLLIKVTKHYGTQKYF